MYGMLSAQYFYSYSGKEIRGEEKYVLRNSLGVIDGHELVHAPVQMYTGVSSCLGRSPHQLMHLL